MMTAEEIKQIISEAMKEGFEFPWILYALVIVATFVGGFYGAYLRKKGENLATKEDYESLLEQLKKTTASTESIKADLAKGNWLHQQSWYLKEKHYSGLLEALYGLRQSLLARLDFYLESGAEYDDRRIHQNEGYKEQTRIGTEALQKIQEHHGPAEMVISDRSIDGLNKFYKSTWHAGNFSACSKDYLDEVYASVDETYELILNEAPNDLN